MTPPTPKSTQSAKTSSPAKKAAAGKASKKTAKKAAKVASARSVKASVGVRLGEEDLLFLDQVAPGEGHSEALRQLIAQARTHAQRPVSVDEAQARIQAILGGAGELRTESGSRSVVVEDLVREALLVVSTALVGPPEPGLEDAGARQTYEALIVDRAFDFLETVLRHTLSESAPAWNPSVMRNRLAATRQTLVASLAASAPHHLPRSRG